MFIFDGYEYVYYCISFIIIQYLSNHLMYKYLLTILKTYNYELIVIIQNKYQVRISLFWLFVLKQNKN